MNAYSFSSSCRMMSGASPCCSSVRVGSRAEKESARMRRRVSSLPSGPCCASNSDTETIGWRLPGTEVRVEGQGGMEGMAGRGREAGRQVCKDTQARTHTHAQAQAQSLTHSLTHTHKI